MELKEAIEIAENYVNKSSTGEFMRSIQTLIEHAKKSIPQLEGEALVGRDVIVMNTIGHAHKKFANGKITGYDKKDGTYKITINYISQWLKSNQFELIDSE
jgi:hypothetical protein